MKKKGIIKNISKIELNNSVFIRVTNTNNMNENINISIYKEIYDGTGIAQYIKVLPDELPIEVVNKLTFGGKYSKLNEIDSECFVKKIEEIQSKIPECNEFKDLSFFEINNICDVTYLFSKKESDGFYVLSSLNINEFSVANRQLVLASSELPYVLMDVLDRNKFDSLTVLIMENHFVRILKVEDKYLCLVCKYSQVEGVASIDVIDIFTILERDDEFVLIRDINNEFAVKVEKDDFKDIMKDFLLTIGLSMEVNYI